jgi:hypothetical protein
MHPSNNMTRTVGGKRYTVKTSTLLASDEYWDGHNWERGGHNTFLYRTSAGAYFRVTLTQWQGERDSVTPLSIEQAKRLWDELEHKQLVDYEGAFGEPTEEAGTKGSNIIVRVTTEEKSAIATAAEKSGKTVTDYLLDPHRSSH